MMTPAKSASDLKGTRNFSGNGSDGGALNNTILLGLPAKERKSIFAKLEFVKLPQHTILNEIGEAIKFGYFVNGGLASILNVMGDGKSVEVGISGKEGFVGLPLLVGFSTSPTRAIMQVEGSAFRVSAKDLIDAVRNSPRLEKSLQRYSQEVGMQATQVAACNRLHEVDERLARWLLMSQDRLGGDFVHLTQEFLAHMLGTRRASVTVAAGILQKAGLITYRRGNVKIDNRQDLEDASCECYNMMRQQSARWKSETESL
jgi:CRP-like cAMP-binding protein